MATRILSPLPVNGTPPQSTQDMTAQLMTITPEMARDLLKDRPPNRPISKPRVQALIDDLRSGRWQTNGESIILDGDLRVLDGQHRLLACAASGIPLTAMVVVGVEASAMATMDQGARRSGADALAASSILRARDVAAVSRWVWRYLHEQMRTQIVPVRNQDLPQFVANHPGLHAALSWGRALRPILPESCAAAFHYLFARSDVILAKEYHSALGSGEGLSAGHPALAVRERAFRERVPAMRHGVAVARAATLVLGWNCLRAGKTCPQGLAWKGERDAAVPFPRIL